MQNINGRKITLSILFILILLVVALIVGKFTFSFMGPDLGEDLTIEGDVTAQGDALIFSKGDDLSLRATTDNFNSDSGNLSDTTNPSVKLISKTKEGANAKYYAGVVIKNNTFTYSTTEKTPEILLTVKDEQGNIITTSSDHLDYVTVGDVSGFDITNKTGIFNIVADFPISATTNTTHTWTFTITFINLKNADGSPIDQSVNENATLELEAKLYKERIVSLASYVANLYTTQGANHLYKHDGSIMSPDGTTVMDAEDNSIRYAGGDYKVADAYKDTYTRITSAMAADTSAVIGYYCDAAESYVGISCTAATKYYFLYYDAGRTQYTTYQDAINKAIADGYVEATPVNNYVCFGSNADACPDDNLYRIIGVFDNKVKLIKADYATSDLLGTNEMLITTATNLTGFSGYRGKLSQINNYKWKLETPNAWLLSELNTQNLNTTFLNNIGDWKNKISETTWYVSGGGVDKIRSVNAKTAYDYEIGVNRLTDYEPIKTKVGLVYLSEYYYAADSSEWVKFGSASDATSDYRSAKDYNWMYLGYHEWSISRFSALNGVWRLDCAGNISRNGINATSSSVRPTFSLTPFVTYTGGTGTETDPIRIN